MTETIPPNIRKAAILIRSLDAETAARLLAQLSPAEVNAVRQAVSALGELDDEERADVASEMRRAAAATVENRTSGVEVALSGLSRQETTVSPQPDVAHSSVTRDNRFAFLNQASPPDLVPLLTREHPQTVAVILSLLEPKQAADLLEALPLSFQAQVLERLADLGDTDPESLQVIERELLAWVARQPQRQGHCARHGDHAFRILASASPAVRGEWASQLSRHNRALAERLSVTLPTAIIEQQDDKTGDQREMPPTQREWPAPATFPNQRWPATVPPVATCVESVAEPPTIPFERLTALDSRTMAAVFREVDSQILRLALAGADDALVDCVAGQLPKVAARQFRASLHTLGPTRLSDVAAAQQVVAQVATRVLARRCSAHTNHV